MHGQQLFHTHARTHAHMHTHTHTHTHTQTNKHTHARARAHTHTHKQIHARTHAHTHTHTHTLHSLKLGCTEQSTSEHTDPPSQLSTVYNACTPTAAQTANYIDFPSTPTGPRRCAGTTARAQIDVDEQTLYIVYRCTWLLRLPVTAVQRTM